MNAAPLPKRLIELNKMSENQLFDECLTLEDKLTAANARIAELERCVVMGGDGKPIGLRSKKWCETTGKKQVFGNVCTIFENSQGDLMVTIKVDKSETPYPRNFVTEKSHRVSSTESVPEGVKE